MKVCAACEDEDHINCGMQTWCECDCDPELALIQTIFDHQDYETTEDDLEDE
jgi:hypothetical protein